MIEIEPDLGRPNPNEIIFLGYDLDGREKRMNRRMVAAYNTVVGQLGFDPLITQGAFMALNPGGGAKASAGYHDRSACIDTRVSDLTDDEQQKVIRIARSVGWAIWRRDEDHGGFSPHMHWVLLGEEDIATGAADQIRQYRDGLDGMGNADYHPRPPLPLPMFNYDKYLKELDMQMKDHVPGAPDDNTVGEALRAAIKLERAFNNFREGETRRHRELKEKISSGNQAIREQLRVLDDEIDALPSDAISRDEMRRIVERLKTDIAKLLIDADDDDDGRGRRPIVSTGTTPNTAATGTTGSAVRNDVAVTDAVGTGTSGSTPV